MKLIKRNAFAGEISDAHLDKKVSLNGWVSKIRKLGEIVFLDLRDRTGIVQIFFDKNIDENLFKKVNELKSEYVIGISGKVRIRENENPDMKTGKYEVVGSDLVIYSASETPPIYVKDDDDVSEDLRLKYRYLDLRKTGMQKILDIRYELTKLTRKYFDELGFREIETPMLIKPTPEGARDYLVPSRVHKGSFYALPQSPQMYKQLLMVSGCDRYIQIAKCFRDEDLRADRQPEFTQIDMELSFTDADEIIAIQEDFLKEVFKKIKGKEITTPFRRFSYDEAMERFGSDKPDTRFGMELHDISSLVINKGFNVFDKAVSEGGSVRGICVKGGSEKYSRKGIDKLTELAKDYGILGLAWIRYTEPIKSSIGKFYSNSDLEEIARAFNAEKGDLILLASGINKVVFDSLGFLRNHIAKEQDLIDEERIDLLWVTDFPMFSLEDDGHKAMHHPFTSPKLNSLEDLKDPKKLKADAYDIVLNGNEIGGGSIRIHDKDVQKEIFKILGMDEEEIEAKFGFLLNAFSYGVPPHGGLAYGLDRLCMILAGASSIKDVIAFPKNQAAECPLSKAPDVADKEQLTELGIQIKK